MRNAIHQPAEGGSGPAPRARTLGRTAVYSFTFNGKEKDDELHNAAGTNVDFGARLYDTRVGRWLSIDPMAAKLPGQSPYSYAACSPIVFIDEGGCIWVNYYTKLVEQQKKLIIDNPNDKKLAKNLKWLVKQEAQTQAIIDELRKNDFALYSYIEDLSYNFSGFEVKVPVYVMLSEERGASPSTAQAVEGGRALAVTRFLPVNQKGYEPNATHNGQEIMAPLTTLPGSKSQKSGFFITIFSGSADRDLSLSNEAGDVMYYMEYNRDALEEGSNGENGQTYEQYSTTGSGKYSFDVQDTYESRRKGCKSNDNKAQGNPYPLKKSDKSK